jgi:magnesium-dependent phosphatase-1
MDLDGTLWDHGDISVLKPPFTRISELEFTDSLGERVRLNAMALEILRYALNRGFITSTLSWNMPEKALEALKVMGVDRLFHYNAIEYHPDKASMALKILGSLRREGRCLGGASIIYIDDREIHLDDMRKALGNLLYIKAWSTCRSTHECVNLIEQWLRLKQG